MADQKLFDNNRIGEILFVGALFAFCIFLVKLGSKLHWQEIHLDRKKEYFAFPLASCCFICACLKRFTKFSTRRRETKNSQLMKKIGS